MEFEYTEPEYDEVKDDYEIRASREDYERESAGLLKLIADRDEFAKLLKIAEPGKIAEVRATLAEFDDLIEDQEKLVELNYRLYQQRQKKWRADMKLMAMCDAIKPELIKHVAENDPEKLELLEAILSGGDKSH